jgi:hypothetical protein
MLALPVLWGILMRVIYCWWIGLLLILAACGGVGDQATPLPPLTLSPPTLAVIEGQCENTADLESWLQATEFSRREFIDLVDEASSKSRQRIYPDVIRLSQILISLSTRPAPDCAESAQSLIIDAMTLTTHQFQRYVNGDRDDLRQIIADARSDFDPVIRELDNLMERLTHQYAAPHATPLG